MGTFFGQGMNFGAFAGGASGPPAGVLVPDVVGETLGDATTAIEGVSLVVGDLTYQTNSTRLLIHMNGDNDGTVFTDDSPSSHIITRVNAVTKTSVKKFGTASGYFDGTGDYLTTLDSDDWNFADGDFTIDMWIRPDTLNASRRMLMQETDADNNFSIGWSSSGRPYFSYKSGAVQHALVIGPVGGPWVADNWYHLAIVREGNTFILYQNGMAIASETSAENMPNLTDLLYIGATSAGAESWLGYLDELRISKGIARWSGVFPPATQAYVSDVNTQLLLHCDGDDDGTVFTDSGNTGHTVSRTGGTVTKTAVKNIGTASLYFDGDGDTLTIPNSSDFIFGSGNFTVEMWINTAISGVSDGLMRFGVNGSAANANTRWLLYTTGDQVVKFFCIDSVAGEYTVESTTNINDENWHHVAAVRSGTSLMLFVDGALEDTQAVSTMSINEVAGDTIMIGTWGTDLYEYTGYMDEIRISKGLARWTSNFVIPAYIAAFTPPTAEYDPTPDGEVLSQDPIANTEVDVASAVDMLISGPGNDKFTTLLLHMDGLNDGTVFTDDSNSNHTITRVNAVTKTAVKQFGTASGYFNGSSYLSIADSEDWNWGTDDFTVDFFARIPNLELPYMLFYQYQDATNRGGMFFSQSADTGLYFSHLVGGVATDYVISTSDAGWSVDTLYHIALVRNGTRFDIYRDGVSLANVTGSDAIPNLSAPFTIGVQNTSTGFLNGYIDEFRVSKGIARWTENFSVPSEAY